MQVRWLSDDDVRATELTPQECMALIHQTMKYHAQGLVEVATKLGIHPPGGRHIHAMPAFIPSLNAAGMKWIADFPSNSKRGLPTLSALIILNDPETGVPTCVMEGRSVTAMRTAAMTGVCLQACASKNTKVATIVGTGVQARAHCVALPHALLNLAAIRVVGREQDAAVRFCREMRAKVGVELIPFPSREQAVTGADVILTVTNSVHTRLLEPEWLVPGVTAVVLDNGGKETTILRAMDRVIVDDAQAFATPEARNRYSSDVPRIDAEIGSILLGRQQGRTSESQRILILNLGIAACDIAVASDVYRRACAMDLGKKMMLSESGPRFS